MMQTIQKQKSSVGRMTYIVVLYCTVYYSLQFTIYGVAKYEIRNKKGTNERMTGRTDGKLKERESACVWM